MKNLRLKAARAALDMSQAELAKRVNVSRQTIVAIEKGTITLRLNCALLFAMNWGKHSTNCFGNGKPL